MSASPAVEPAPARPATTRPATTERLAGFVTGATAGPEVLAAATPVVLDTLAVTLAGGAEPGVRTLMEALAGDDGASAVPSFWDRRRYRPDDAALLVGMASHMLDYDDVCTLAMCHPSSPVLSALLASADRRRVSGRDLLAAFAVGTEVLIRLGQAMGFRHYALGFHATATLGTVGAAAACARLLGLDRRRTAHALAIAASLASGLRANFGSMVKPLHVGVAAANGQKAARLAAAGVEGAAEAFDGEGFLHAFSGGTVAAWPDGLELGRPFAIVAPGFEQKRYPCCYMLHKIIEATLALRREEGVGVDDLRSAHVRMPNGGTKPLIHPHPGSGLNALFSGPYAVLAGLSDGRVDLGSFTDAAVLRPEVQARLAAVTLVEDETQSRQGADIGAAPVTVTLALASGAEVSRTVVASPGSRQDPLTEAQLRAKWADCLLRARPEIPGATLERLFDEGRSLAAAPDIAGWLGRLTGAVAGP